MNFVWNMRFQEALELPEETKEEQTIKYQTMAQISEDFVTCVKLYGKVIISELQENERNKTITRSSLGGVAGGWYCVRWPW